jgi:hypothetical protein
MRRFGLFKNAESWPGEAGPTLPRDFVVARFRLLEKEWTLN